MYICHDPLRYNILSVHTKTYTTYSIILTLLLSKPLCLIQHFAEYIAMNVGQMVALHIS